MTSFHVCNLFINISLDECIELCQRLIWELWFYPLQQMHLWLLHFRKLLCFVVKENNYFSNGKLYVQLDGVALGSQLGPTLTNIFTCALEACYLNDCLPSVKPILYRRFVDEIFCLFVNPEHVNCFLEYINSFHPITKF